MKNNEKKVLGILSIVFASLALLGSWIPILNNVSFVIAIPALILGVIGLIINRKNKKVLAIVGTALSIAAMVIVLATQSLYGKAIDEADKAIKTSVQKTEETLEANQQEAAAKFKWTKSDVDALVVGDTISGIGGANYDEIIKRFGAPQIETESTSGDYSSRFVDYNNMGSSNYKSVSLQFTKQGDGSWLLSSKSSTGLE